MQQYVCCRYLSGAGSPPPAWSIIAPKRCEACWRSRRVLPSSRPSTANRRKLF